MDWRTYVTGKLRLGDLCNDEFVTIKKHGISIRTTITCVFDNRSDCARVWLSEPPRSVGGFSSIAPPRSFRTVHKQPSIGREDGLITEHNLLRDQTFQGRGFIQRAGGFHFDCFSTIKYRVILCCSATKEGGQRQKPNNAPAKKKHTILRVIHRNARSKKAGEKSRCTTGKRNMAHCTTLEPKIAYAIHGWQCLHL